MLILAATSLDCTGLNLVVDVEFARNRRSEVRESYLRGSQVTSVRRRQMRFYEDLLGCDKVLVVR
jgi:hypothetical protein